MNECVLVDVVFHILNAHNCRSTVISSAMTRKLSILFKNYSSHEALGVVLHLRLMGDVVGPCFTQH